MAITTTIEANTFTLKLNNGRDEQGRQKVLNVNLTNLKKEAFTAEDMQKAMNIANALGDCFDNSILERQLTTRYTIAQSA